MAATCFGTSAHTDRWRRIVASFSLPALLVLLLAAHIGDSNSYYRGSAGPYTVQVIVRHPGVVPGLADITVRVEDEGVTRVTVRPVHSALGLDGAPRPDVATPVPGEPGLFAAQLWFMTLGAYSVHVEVDGAAGSGTAVVPVNSLATRTLPMSATLSVVLAALGLFLAVGLLTIVRAAVLESTVPPGDTPTAAQRRRAHVSVGLAVVLLFLVVTGGRAWWNAEANAYRGILFQPLALRVAPATIAGVRVLDMEVGDRNWLGTATSPIVPDHGKLLHGFLVRVPDQDAFAHVHPWPIGERRFRLPLPPLPPGRYVFYGDIVHETGFSQTLVTEVDLDADQSRCELADACPAADPDDAWWTGPAQTADDAVFEDGASLRWLRPAEPIIAGQPFELRFAATDDAGQALPLEPYMGMAAHAAVRRDDGSVFVHLHPTGSISVAAQQALAIRAARDTAATAAHWMHAAGAPDGLVSILYAFPRGGRYRLWVQVKAAGETRTAAWDVTVADPR